MERGCWASRVNLSCPPDCFDRCRRWRKQIRASVRTVNRIFWPHSSSGADQDTTASADERRRGLSTNPLQDPSPPYRWEIVASSVECHVWSSIPLFERTPQEVCTDDGMRADPGSDRLGGQAIIAVEDVGGR